MNIDELIRDLIVEDQFKTKYTKREQSIFCKNMYYKIQKFIEPYEEANTQLVEYKKKCKNLQLNYESSNKSNHCLLTVILLLNAYYVYIFYKQSLMFEQGQKVTFL
jgi:hypothetical protein